ncbi:hypothetical protein GW17_00001633 [Ensete ventricosum]|nr:hypothetical protein GW17_00001633 [Ensete ventricosum]
MATTFDRWEKDPFFAAAEEVQDSADRLESVYRQWTYKRESASKSAGGDEPVSVELKRELYTALGTAKWQLEEFEKAVRSNDEALSVGEGTRARHSEFTLAIGSRISALENSLRETNLKAGEGALTWVRLDERENDELAQFLSYTSLEERKEIPISSTFDVKVGNDLIRRNGEALIGRSKGSCHSKQLSSLHIKDQKVHNIHRSASCAGDIGACAITIPSEGEDTSERSSDDRSNLPPPRVLSLSGLSSALDSTSRMRWYKNGFRKWSAQDQHDVMESIPLGNHEPSQGINGCYERSKSCLSSRGQDVYNKHLYGYLGAFQRLLRRSQYQIQYGHHIKTILWATLVVLLIGEIPFFYNLCF